MTSLVVWLEFTACCVCLSLVAVHRVLLLTSILFPLVRALVSLCSPSFVSTLVCACLCMSVARVPSVPLLASTHDDASLVSDGPPPTHLQMATAGNPGFLLSFTTLTNVSLASRKGRAVHAKTQSFDGGLQKSR